MSDPSAQTGPSASRSDLHFARRVLIGSTVTLAVAACFAVVYASSLVASLFLAVLFALGLRGLAGWIAERTPLGTAPWMIAVLLLLVGSAVAFGVGVAPALSRQIEQMSEQLPQQLQQVEQTLRQSPLGEALLGSERSPGGSPQAPSAGGSGERTADGDLAWSGSAGRLLNQVTASDSLISGISQAASGVVAVLASIFLIVISALYLAFRPGPYTRGFLGLLPMRAREPVVLIGFQVLTGIMFGLPGLIVSAPLLVVVDVLVRCLWREETLHDPSVAAQAT